MEKNSNIEMNEEYGERILWKDRKRILGMPISFTKYEITEDRFICHNGFFRTEVNEILLYRVLDLKLVRTLGQKILGVGTIHLYTADKSDEQFVIQNIKKPEAVRRFISKIVERERDEKRVLGKEMYGTAGTGTHIDFDGDCPHEFDGESFN